MNLFTRKMRMFCVSNMMVSFVCTGFLGINGYNGGIIESHEENAHEISLTASDTEPVSQLGKEEKRENALENVEDSKRETEKVKKEETKTTTKNTTSTKTTKKVTNVVTKKEVKKTVTYAPASYSSVIGDAIVSYAKRYLGLRYKTGTPSLTNGADCSGFTQLIFREFGVSLPRTVSGQIGRGTYVKKSDLQKGDLVFYKAKGARGGATHVAIYIGGGQVIHESRPGVGVKINSVNMMQYVTARRVINSKAKEIAEQKQLEEQKANENLTDNASNSNETINDNETISINNNVNNNVVSENNVNNNAVEEGVANADTTANISSELEDDVKTEKEVPIKNETISEVVTPSDSSESIQE